MSLRIQYGGSFDPVHNGHLAVALAAREALQAGVWLMPAADPPHKDDTGAPAAARLAMLEQAVAGHVGLHVDARELRREGASYTVDTLHGLRRELGARQPLALLMGADSFLALPRWRHWQQLLGLAHFIIAERPGSSLALAHLPEALRAHVADAWQASPAALATAPAGLCWRLSLPLRSEASSRIRQQIAQGDAAWEAAVPSAVAAYIRANGLYRHAGGCDGFGKALPTL